MDFALLGTVAGALWCSYRYANLDADFVAQSSRAAAAHAAALVASAGGAVMSIGLAFVALIALLGQGFLPGLVAPRLYVGACGLSLGIVTGVEALALTYARSSIDGATPQEAAPREQSAPAAIASAQINAAS
jgi:hypothetical protein